MLPDQHLLKRLRCGDGSALRAIYEKYRNDLFTVAVSLLHDVHASEDCLQDVFVSLADAGGNVSIRRNLKGYLVSCVANRARDRLRKRPTLLDCPLDESGPLAAFSDPAETLITREESVQVFKALARLPYQQREVFVLHVQGGMKFREIAKLQDVSVKTVLSRYRYGIKKLRVLLEKGERT